MDYKSFVAGNKINTCGSLPSGKAGKIRYIKARLQSLDLS